MSTTTTRTGHQFARELAANMEASQPTTMPNELGEFCVNVLVRADGQDPLDIDPCLIFIGTRADEAAGPLGGIIVGSFLNTDRPLVETFNHHFLPSAAA